MSKQGFSNYLKDRVASSTRSNYLRYIQVDKYITRLKELTNFDIFSIISVTELDDIIELLKSDPAYCEEDKKTRYHSSSALKKISRIPMHTPSKCRYSKLSHTPPPNHLFRGTWQREVTQGS